MYCFGVPLYFCFHLYNHHQKTSCSNILNRDLYVVLIYIRFSIYSWTYIPELIPKQTIGK